MLNTDFYIAYLLTKHECVIIQGFGAFVVSKTEQHKKRSEELLCPPSYSLGFNPEIKHNDGLLANTIAKGKKISYKESCLQIHQYVDFLEKQLAEQKTIQIPWIGNLSLSAEKKIIFTPSVQPSCNAIHFGLNNFYMLTLKELKDSAERPGIKPDESTDFPVNRRIVRWVGSVAAAALALFLVATPLNRHSSLNSQQAGFIPSQYIILDKTQYDTPSKELEVITDEFIEKEQSIEEESTSQALNPEVVVKPIQYYYIVISSLPTRESAEKKMQNFQQNGFPEANVVSAEDKHRIYINKFENKTEAEIFLRTFRKDYPKHSNAWLLSQKN